MRFRFARSDDYPEGLRLPWGTPLEQWPDALFVDVEHGLHRNPVRFAEYEGAAYPIKELLEHVAEREYTLLRALELQQLPVVEPIGLVTERPHPPGQVDRRGLLVTRFLRHSMLVRQVIAHGTTEAQAHQLLDALAGLLVNLHLAGFYWRDCSLSNALFRLDAGRDTDLGLAALTDKDVADLAAVVQFADKVALSFLRTPGDVVELEDRLHALGAGHLGIVLKVENAAAFQNLPRILLASLRSPPVGVMVARGDLAVEIGFERLSEVQEEILWLCEAAHVPVIWATQVREGLAKAGAPSRAEVSDAMMSSRAECVMLNKGPRIVETVGFLAHILNRMEEHHDKRMALLRRLSVSAL